MSSEPGHNPQQPESSEEMPEFDNEIRSPESVEEDVVESAVGVEQDGPSKPRLGRLHPLSLVFEAISHVRSLIIPSLLAIFSAANGRVDGLILAGIIFVPTVITSAIRYFSLRYQICESELVVTQGIFFRRIRTVPIERIQNIDLIQNVLHRVFNVAEVRIETASGTEPEATLRVLSMKKVDLLRESIFNPRREFAAQDAEHTDVPNGAQPHAAPHLESTVLHKIKLGELVRAGLASNRGTLLLGVLLGLYFQFDEQLHQFIDVEKFIRNVSDGMETTMLIAVIIAGVMAVLLLFRLLGIAWYILRFHGYQLSRSGEDLRIQCGLFTKVSATVPRKRIQFISIHQNIWMRWMGLSSIRIETAGAAGKGKEDATKTVSSRWFLPVVKDERVRELVEILRPGLVWDMESFEWQPISPRASRRMARIAIVASLILSVAGYFSLGWWGIAVGVFAMVPLVWLAIKRSQSKKYTCTDQIVAYRSGILNRKTSMTFFEKIQTVSVYQSPFDRRWNMATLSIDTAAAGPADHKIQIKYLTSETARNQFEAIVEKSSDQRPVFS